MNLIELAAKFDTEEKCISFLEAMRWPEGVQCPKCGNSRISRFQASGKTGKMRHLYQCLSCRYQFSVRTGTIFHDSHLPLQKWFTAMALIGESRGGISANQLRQALGVQYKTAWHMAHRLRDAMQQSAAEASSGEASGAGTQMGGERDRRRKSRPWDQQAFLRFVERSGQAETTPVSSPDERVWERTLPRGVAREASVLAKDRPASTGTVLRPEAVAPRSPVAGSPPSPIEALWNFWKRGLFGIGSFPVVGARHLPGYMNEVTYLWGSMFFSALQAGILRPLGKGLQVPQEAQSEGPRRAKR